MTVAAFGPSFSWQTGVFVGENFEDQRPDVPYEDRRKVSLDVGPKETLGAVIDRAAAEFGVAPGADYGDSPISDVITGVVFYQPGDEGGVDRPQPWPSLIRVLDESGSPSWSVAWNGVRYEELLAAAEAGLVDGDPLRPYFWPVIPQGEVVTISVFAALWSLDRALGGIVEELASDFAKRVWPRVRGARDLTTRSEWTERLARPDSFVAYMRREPRTSDDAAVLLHCSASDAEAVLWGMGFAFDQETETWVWAGDAEAAIIGDALEHARIEGELPTAQELRDDVRRAGD